jgi:uncharacterized protein YbjT (DUF2867 family)
MNVLVAGAHGQVGIQLTELLVEGEHDIYGLVRSRDQIEDIESFGAEAVLGDLTEEEDVERAVEGRDAIVFAAGSGGENVTGVDRDGAISMIDAAEDAAVPRFVMLSAMNADAPEDGPDALREYLEAKAAADAHLRKSSLTYTIVRPGALTDDAPTGEISVGETLDRGKITRADVAQVLAATLTIEATHGETFEVLAGEDPIEAALEALPSTEQ